MNASRSKRGMGWGVMLVVFGIAALLDMYWTVADWWTVGLFAAGGLVILVIFLVDRSEWQLLIPAYILLAVAAIAGIAIGGFLEGDVLGATVLGLVALPFFAVFLVNRENWWALIPGWVLFSIGVMILLIGFGVLEGGIIPLYVLSSIGLPFLVVFLVNRDNWWALIPAYVMFAIGLMVALIDARVLDDLAIPAYVMFSVAIPFFVVFLSNRSQRWALIPGGITGLMGLAFFAGTDLAKYVIPAVLIIAGAWVLLRSFVRREE